MAPRYAALGEDRSDARTLAVFIRRLAEDPSLHVKSEGYDGCAQLLRKGARVLDLLYAQGYERFVVAYDADRCAPEERYEEARRRILVPSRVSAAACCIVVPVQEIEAWLLADVAAVAKRWPGWRTEEFHHPERVRDPKETLEKLSRDARQRPRYNHATDNEVVARDVDLGVIERKCPSFQALARFVRAG
jgi:hypothetical protein